MHAPESQSGVVAADEPAQREDGRAADGDRPATWAFVPVVVVIQAVATVLGFAIAVVVSAARVAVARRAWPDLTAIRTDPSGPVTQAFTFFGTVAGLAWLFAGTSAAAARVPVRRWLGLGRGRLRLRDWWVAVVGAFAALSIGGAIAGGLMAIRVLPPIGGARIELAHAFTATRGTMDAWWMLVAGAVLAPVGEELLYRGYLQRGLLNGWREGTAWGITAVVFAASHGDVTYAVLILPLALWIGFVAIRADSILPGIAVHVAINGWVQGRALFAHPWLPPVTPAWTVAVLVLPPVVLALAARCVAHTTRVGSVPAPSTAVQQPVNPY